MMKENMLWKCRKHKGIQFTDNNHNNLRILQAKMIIFKGALVIKEYA